MDKIAIAERMDTVLASTHVVEVPFSELNKALTKDNFPDAYVALEDLFEQCGSNIGHYECDKIMYLQWAQIKRDLLKEGQHQSWTEDSKFAVTSDGIAHASDIVQPDKEYGAVTEDDFNW